MRRNLRTILIGVLVVALSFNPAAAWFFNRGGGCGYGGGYGCGYGGWGHRSFGHAHRTSHYGGWGYGGYSHQPVVYHGSYCGGSYSGGWGSYGGCGSCGGWDSCDGCGSYSYGESYGGYESYDSHEGVIVDSYDGYEVAPERAPMAPADMPANGRSTMPPPTQGPSRVERPMDTTPVPQLPVEPMPRTTPPADDLLPPTEEPPADDLFNGTEAAPTTPPPAEDTNDLFAPTTEPAETPPPAEAPAETPPPADTETDDLFGTPLTEEAPAETTEDAPADTEEMPAEEAPAEEGETTDEDDIFGTSSGILRAPGGLASTELRTWVDNTGEHSCRGRLIRFLDGKVRLLKDNGRTTTVPLYRLSASDLAFVHRQASAQQATVAGQLATSMTGLPLLAN